MGPVQHKSVVAVAGSGNDPIQHHPSSFGMLHAQPPLTCGGLNPSISTASTACTPIITSLPLPGALPSRETRAAMPAAPDALLPAAGRRPGVAGPWPISRRCTTRPVAASRTSLLMLPLDARRGSRELSPPSKELSLMLEAGDRPVGRAAQRSHPQRTGSSMPQLVKQCSYIHERPSSLDTYEEGD